MHHSFFHVRRFKEDGSINPLGGVTICVTRDYFPTDPGRALVSFGRCRDDELYNRRIGREVSRGRALDWANGGESYTAEVRVPASGGTQAQLIQMILEQVDLAGVDHGVISILRRQA